MDVPRIMVQERRLSVLLAMDGEKFCAYCPELDLVTEMDTYEETIEDMIEAIKDYANEYVKEINLYSKSPNRAHHLPYIEAIRSCKTDWELRMLIEIKHGLVYI
jgi:predicted RNase H-like HicB family nuclease